MDKPSSLVVTIVRWVARVLSAVIVVFKGMLLGSGVVGSLLGAQGPSQPGPTSMADYVYLILMVIGLGGLVLAWKWELVGAAIVLVTFAGTAFIHPGILSNPLELVTPIAAILFLASWWFNRPRGQEESS